MNHLDLFSGIGGFALAAKWCGIETIQFVEIDKFCQKVLAKNFPNVPIHGDIKTFNCDKKIDLLTGGFPCQPFSIAGSQKGIFDDRYLWPEMFRVIRGCYPSWIIAENVSGMVEMELENILSDLENHGYETQSFIIPACAANAPHRRDRLWIIANHNSGRCYLRASDREKRYIQEDQIRNLAQIQSKWEELKPFAWQTLCARGWLDNNADCSRADYGLSNRVDRLRSLGNAIVPQVVYPIMKTIQLIS